MNLAAMLDMAFQLLTFFILTFRPAPIEGQLALNLPPPVPQTKVEAEKKITDGPIGDVLAMNTLHLQVVASPTGDVGDVKIETNSVVQGHLDADNLQTLDRKLQATFATQQVAFDRVQIAVDGKLRYGELMKIIDVCHRQKLPDGTQMQKISFTEIGSDQSKPSTGSSGLD
jgi:biopolymer transport protein ExbD